jgi:hypothetical protein
MLAVMTSGAWDTIRLPFALLAWNPPWVAYAAKQGVGSGVRRGNGERHFAGHKCLAHWRAAIYRESHIPGRDKSARG